MELEECICSENKSIGGNQVRRIYTKNESESKSFQFITIQLDCSAAAFHIHCYGKQIVSLLAAEARRLIYLFILCLQTVEMQFQG